MTNRVALSMDLVSGVSILFAARRLKLETVGRIIPVMGVLSAFVFAAQMLNFPVLGGTSGHLVGGALLGILLGPVAGFLTMATVIIAQALFLQDGGLLALGANVFNIGAVTVFCGFGVYRLFGAPDGPGKRLPWAGFAAGWISVLVSAVACALQLGISGAVPLNVGLPAMAGYHAVIGLAEGGLTAGVLSFLLRARPDLLRKEVAPRFDWSLLAAGIFLVATPLVILILAGNSGLPDPLQALLSGVQVPAERGEPLQSPDRAGDFYRVAIFVAILLSCGIAFLAARMLRSRRGPS